MNLRKKINSPVKCISIELTYNYAFYVDGMLTDLLSTYCLIFCRQNFNWIIEKYTPSPFLTSNPNTHHGDKVAAWSKLGVFTPAGNHFLMGSTGEFKAYILQTVLVVLIEIELFSQKVKIALEKQTFQVYLSSTYFPAIQICSCFYTSDNFTLSSCKIYICF